MQITKEYLAECDQNVTANFHNRKHVVGPYTVQLRVRTLQAFCASYSTILDIGSGGHMPVVLKATHACDLSTLALPHLQQLGWKGEFKIASCDNLPYQDKQFEAASCSEVIEHLPDLESVRKTFKEIDRVAKNWIITTPCASKSGVRDRWNIEKTHKQFFTPQDLVDLAAPIKINTRVINEYDIKHIICTRASS